MRTIRSCCFSAFHRWLTILPMHCNWKWTWKVKVSAKDLVSLTALPNLPDKSTLPIIMLKNNALWVLLSSIKYLIFYWKLSWLINTVLLKHKYVWCSSVFRSTETERARVLCNINMYIPHTNIPLFHFFFV